MSDDKDWYKDSAYPVYRCRKCYNAKYFTQDEVEEHIEDCEGQDQEEDEAQ